MNGPPGIGKSWLSAQLSKLFGAGIHTMSYGECVYEELTLELNWAGTYTDFKANVFEDGLSGRQKLIDRGNHGRWIDKDYWSRKLVEHRKFGTRPVLVLDGVGFIDEQLFLIQHAETVVTIVIAPLDVKVGDFYKKPEGGFDNRTCLVPHNGFRVTNSTAALAVMKWLLHVSESPYLPLSADYEHNLESLNSNHHIWQRLRLVRSMVESGS